jgi:hypothetical protein
MSSSRPTASNLPAQGWTPPGPASVGTGAVQPSNLVQPFSRVRVCAWGREGARVPPGAGACTHATGDEVGRLDV